MGEGEGEFIISKLKHTETNNDHCNTGRTVRSRTLEMMNILKRQTFTTGKSL